MYDSYVPAGSAETNWTLARCPRIFSLCLLLGFNTNPSLYEFTHDTRLTALGRHTPWCKYTSLNKVSVQREREQRSVASHVFTGHSVPEHWGWGTEPASQRLTEAPSGKQGAERDNPRQGLIPSWLVVSQTDDRGPEVTPGLSQDPCDNWEWVFTGIMLCQDSESEIGGRWSAAAPSQGSYDIISQTCR